MSKKKNSIPKLLSINPLTQSKEFSAKDFVNYSKKVGGQFNQFYSLTINNTYTSVDYLETEVLFSREP